MPSSSYYYVIIIIATYEATLKAKQMMIEDLSHTMSALKLFIHIFSIFAKWLKMLS